ncbi:rCG40875 [Rattus norvegicus]|uniref:RCG40875 n=1 Tax=Rattus norvegicus TaxID=10116 RepID=A6KL45_RAT|nr:rCG40875 [Rattus norvegicus]
MGHCSKRQPFYIL